MYKSTQDNGDYIGRVGSHATKLSSNLSNLPDNIRGALVEAASFCEQLKSLSEQHIHWEEEAKHLRQRLRTTLPVEEFRLVSKRREWLSQRIRESGKKMSEIRRCARKAKEVGWTSAFVEVARETLSQEQFSTIARAASEMLPNDIPRVRPGNSDLSPEKRRRNNKALDKKRKRKRDTERVEISLNEIRHGLERKCPAPHWVVDQS